jgi:hypothetical protein
VLQKQIDDYFRRVSLNHIYELLSDQFPRCLGSIVMSYATHNFNERDFVNSNFHSLTNTIL